MTYSRCHWEAGDERCWYPGSMSTTTQADEHTKWFCQAHFYCNDPALGAAIVRDSLSYRHRPDLRQMNIEASRFCRENGLNTVDEMRAFCRQNFKNIGRKAA